MALFALVFLSVYSLMHVVVFQAVRPLWRWHGRHLAWLLPTLVSSPLLVRLLEHGGYPRLAALLAWPAYLWLGLLFLAFCLAGPLCVWWALTHLAGWSTLKPGRGEASALVVIVAICGGVALFEANDVKIEQVALRTEKNLPGSGVLRVVQLSDWHLGLLTRKADVEQVVRKVRGLQPDLVLITGDLIDARSADLDAYADLLKTLRPRYGSYMVTGNHETYVGLDLARGFAQRAGIGLLRNRLQPIADRVLLIGVDDPAAGGRDDIEAALLQTADPRFYRILLKHRPQVLAADEVLRADFQLSGHAHRGQIFPFGLLTGWRYPLQDGLSRLAQGAWLYASRGTGCWGPPMRLGSPAEVTLFEISSSGLAAPGEDQVLLNGMNDSQEDDL